MAGAIGMVVLVVFAAGFVVGALAAWGLPRH